MATSRTEYTRRAAIAVGLAALALIIVFVLWSAARLLLLIFGGVLLAILLRALAELLARYTRLRESWCVWIVVAVLVSVFGLGGWRFSAQIADQFDALGGSVAAVWDTVHARLAATAWGQELLQRLGNGEVAAGSLGSVGRVIGGLVAGVSGLVISIFIGLYVAVNPRLYRQGLVHLFPVRLRGHAKEILSELHETLRSWLIGTFALMIVVGTATFAGLWALGIPLALSLALIAFVFEFVPYLGPILSAVPAVLVAFTLGPQEVVFVVLLYWGIQSLEGYVLAPLVYQRSVQIPPMLSLTAQVLMGTLFGIVGIIFATPLTACAMVLVKRLYVEDVLGERIE